MEIMKEWWTNFSVSSLGKGKITSRRWKSLISCKLLSCILKFRYKAMTHAIYNPSIKETGILNSNCWIIKLEILTKWKALVTPAAFLWKIKIHLLVFLVLPIRLNFHRQRMTKNFWLQYWSVFLHYNATRELGLSAGQFSHDENFPFKNWNCKTIKSYKGNEKTYNHSSWNCVNDFSYLWAYQKMQLWLNSHAV